MEEKRNAAEEALMESERRLSSIYDTVGDIIFHLAVEGDGIYRFISVNQAFCNVTGLCEDMIVGKLVNEVIPEPTLSMVLEKYGLAIKENSIIRWEETSNYPTGRLIGDVSIAPVINEKGRCTYLVGTVHDITERKRAEEELHQSRALFHSLVESLPQNVFSKDKQGRFTFANKRYCAAEGKTLGDILGKTDFDMHPPELAEKYQSDDRIIMETGQIVDTDEIHQPLGGEKFYSHVIKAPLYDSKGKASGIVGLFWDITEQKMVENALRENEERFRVIFDNATDGILLISLENQMINSANNSMAQMLGYSVEDLVKLSSEEIHPEENLPFVSGLIENQAKDRLAPAGDIPMKRKDGSVFYANVRGALIILSGRKYLLGVFRDITERKKAEKAIQESEAKFRRIFENVQEVYFEVSLDGIVIEISPSIEIITKGQYHRDDLIGSLIYEIWADAGDRQVFLSKLQERGSIADYEIMVKNRDGSLVSCSMSSKIWFHAQGQPESIIGSIRDISERKRAEQILKASEVRYRRLFESAKDGIIILDAETGKIIDINPFLTSILGYTYEQLLGKTIWEIGSFKDIIANRKKFLELRRKGLVRYEDLPLETIEGRRIEVEFVSNIYLVNDRNVIQCNIRDITERKHTEEELVKYRDHLEELVKKRTAELTKSEEKLIHARDQAEAANKAKTVFLSSMSMKSGRP